MSKKFKDSESERFIYAIDCLILNGKLKSYYKLAKELGIPLQRFTDIKAGRQSAQRKLIDDFCEKYPIVNKKYLTMGEGEVVEFVPPVIINNKEDNTERLIAEKDKRIDELTKRIKDVEELRDIYKLENERLKKELAKTETKQTIKK